MMSEEQRAAIQSAYWETIEAIARARWMAVSAAKGARDRALEAITSSLPHTPGEDGLEKGGETVLQELLNSMLSSPTARRWLDEIERLNTNLEALAVLLERYQPTGEAIEDIRKMVAELLG